MGYVQTTSNPGAIVDNNPSGTNARRRAAALGAWTVSVHAAEVTRRPLRNVSASDDQTLSEEHLYWVSELGRLTELAGALNARVEIALLELKALKARTRSRIRTQHSGEKLTAQMLDDEAESDSAVMEAERELSELRLIAAHVAAAKEATGTYVAGLSREITLRGDQRRSRTY